MEKVKKLVALELIFDDGTRERMGVEEFAKTSELVVRKQIKELMGV